MSVSQNLMTTPNPFVDLTYLVRVGKGSITIVTVVFFCNV